MGVCPGPAGSNRFFTNISKEHATRAKKKRSITNEHLIEGGERERERENTITEIRIKKSITACGK